MPSSKTTGDTELLEQLCRQHGISPELVRQLLRIEREHQFQERRHGINEELRQCIEASLRSEQTNT